MKEEERSISFPTAFLGLFMAPGDTMAALIQNGVPRKGLLFLLCFFVVLYGPFVAWYVQTGKFMYKPEMAICLTLFILLTLFVFVFCEKILLTLLNVNLSVATITHMSCYCLSSLTMAILMIYGLNYWSSGGESIQYLTFFPQGFARLDERFAGYLPMMLHLGSVFMGLQFAAGIRVAGNLIWTSAIFITILSLLPLAGGMILSLFLSEEIYPGFIELVRSVYAVPSSLMDI